MCVEFSRYAEKNGYPVETWQRLACECGGTHFQLFSDDEEGSALALCCACGNEHDIAESVQYADDLVQNICSCDNEELTIYVGTCNYPGTADPRWTYVGASCHTCGLKGIYVDWQER